ncbi:MAG: enoyl-CoA hydratase/isomerase family protein [Peptostreptococcales bacterium]|jgi:2-(1,2-epoxy-1,2-dihydrophenyl)acetyl-CoA isomerase
MDYSLIIKKQENGIGFLTLNSPETFNSFSVEMTEEILHALKAFSEDNTIRVVVISGNDSGFCAGGDLKSMIYSLNNGDIVADYFKPVLNMLVDIVLTIRRMDKPVIASVQKAATGAGFNFALACDFRIATENAVFVQSFVNLGMIPYMGGMYFLNHYLGATKAMELVMLGSVLRSQEAYELGLLSKRVPNDKLEEETINFANKFVKGPKHVYKSLKELANKHFFSDLESFLKDEYEHELSIVETGDFAEGARAFLEKREAIFNGK